MLKFPNGSFPRFIVQSRHVVVSVAASHLDVIPACPYTRLLRGRVEAPRAEDSCSRPILITASPLRHRSQHPWLAEEEVYFDSPINPWSAGSGGRGNSTAEGPSQGKLLVPWCPGARGHRRRGTKMSLPGQAPGDPHLLTCPTCQGQVTSKPPGLDLGLR